MAGSYYVPLAPYNPGPGINLEPINKVLDGITQQQNRRAILDFQTKEFDANQKQRQVENDRSMRQEHLGLLDRGARQANAIAQMPAGSRERNAAWAAHIDDHKRNFPNEALTPEELDPISGPQIYASQVGLALESPDAIALRRAQIAEANASTAKSNADVAASRRQASLIKTLMPEFYGDQPQPDQQPFNASGNSPAPSATMPGNALARPQNNVLANEPSYAPPQTISEPINNALLPGISGQAARAVSSARSMPQPGNALAVPVNQILQPSPSTSLPAPGDPTSFTGDSASGMTTPSRISPETRRAMAYDLALNGGKGMSSIINNDPGSQYAKSYAVKTAEDNAAINMKQKMTLPMLDIIQSMREKIDAAGPDIAQMATGPDYGKLSDDPGWVESGGKALLPDTSGEFYQNARAGVRNVLNSTAGYLPGMSQYTQPLADKGNAARDLNLELHHLTKGIGAGVKAIPGTKGGGVSTDADQALVLDAVGEAMHSANPTTRASILHDAENILRARAGMPRLPAPPGYKPSGYASKAAAASPSAPATSGWAASSQWSTTPQKTSAIVGARDAIQKGADPAAVRQRLIQNGINPDGL